MIFESIPKGDIVFSAEDAKNALIAANKKMEEYKNEKIKEIFEEIGYDIELSNCSIIKLIENLNEYFSAESKSIEDINKNYNSNKYISDNISSFKKRIKYCKNPMEKKKLEKDLNILYKNRRRKR